MAPLGQGGRIVIQDQNEMTAPAQDSTPHSCNPSTLNTCITVAMAAAAVASGNTTQASHCSTCIINLGGSISSYIPVTGTVASLLASHKSQMLSLFQSLQTPNISRSQQSAPCMHFKDALGK
jgi:hypothetical protein